MCQLAHFPSHHLLSNNFVVHAEDSQKLFPAVFVLLPGKTRAIYDRMLHIIMTLCPNISAIEVMTDFEYQAMKAFEGSLRVGFTQDLHKNIVQYVTFRTLKIF